jgi:hypothetical protein
MNYTNYYECLEDGTTWNNDADCMCNDRCPNCNAEITPVHSEEWPSEDNPCILVFGQLTEHENKIIVTDIEAIMKCSSAHKADQLGKLLRSTGTYEHYIIPCQQEKPVILTDGEGNKYKRNSFYFPFLLKPAPEFINNLLSNVDLTDKVKFEDKGYFPSYRQYAIDMRDLSGTWIKSFVYDYHEDYAHDCQALGIEYMEEPKHGDNGIKTDHLQWIEDINTITCPELLHDLENDNIDEESVLCAGLYVNAKEETQYTISAWSEDGEDLINIYKYTDKEEWKNDCENLRMKDYSEELA